MATTGEKKAWADENDGEIPDYDASLSGQANGNSKKPAWSKASEPVAPKADSNAFPALGEKRAARPAQTHNDDARQETRRSDDARQDDRRGGYERRDDDRRGGYERRDGGGGYDRRDDRRGDDRRDDRRGYDRRDDDRRGGYDRRDDRPREKREAPENPPFTAFVGGIPPDVSEEEIQNFFEGGQVAVANVRLVRHSDTNNVKMAFVEFKTRNDLIESLSADGHEFCGRPIRVDVAEERQPPRNKERSSFFRGGDRDRDRDRDDGQHFVRLESPAVPSGPPPREENRRREPRSDRPPSSSAPTQERTPLQLKPRSETAESSASGDSKPKSSPFGQAKPRDENEILRKKEEERAAREAQRAAAAAAAPAEKEANAAAAAGSSAAGQSRDGPRSARGPRDDRRDDRRGGDRDDRRGGDRDDKRGGDRDDKRGGDDRRDRKPARESTAPETNWRERTQQAVPAGARRRDDDRPPRRDDDRPPRRDDDRPPRREEDRPPRRDGPKPDAAGGKKEPAAASAASRNTYAALLDNDN